MQLMTLVAFYNCHTIKFKKNSLFFVFFLLNKVLGEKIFTESNDPVKINGYTDR